MKQFFLIENKMKRKYFLITVQFLILLSSVSTAQNNDNANIKLVLKNPEILKSNIVRLFVSTDSSGFGTPQLLTKNSNEFHIKNPTFLLLANDLQIPFYVKPGEVLSVSINKDSSLLLFIEGNKVRSNEIDFFRKLINRYGKFYFNYPTKKFHPKLKNMDSVNYFLNAINSISKKRISYLDSCLGANLISNDFYSVAKNILNSSRICDLQLLYWNNRDLLIRELVYNDIVNKIFEEVKQAPFLPCFLNFTINRIAISMIMTKYLNYEIIDSISLMKRLKFIDKNYSNLAKDFMLTNTIRSSFLHSFSVSDEQMQIYFKNCHNSDCKKLIQDLTKNKLKQNKTITPNAVLSIDTSTMTDFYYILKNQKSQYIVLDFWASWCAPCREAMPESEKIRKEFKSKGIEFIYLSLDENISSWKQAHESEGLPDSQSYLIINANNSNIIRDNNINLIPRYMLVSNKGEIINTDLPHLNNPRFRAILKELINSNMGD